MGLFGRKKSDVPPDIGAENRGEYKEAESGEDSQDASPSKIKFESSNRIASGEANNLQFERLLGRMEAISSWIENFQERFSNIEERIGELRSSTIKNEKEVSRAIMESSKAADLVKEVRPEALRIEYQRLGAKCSSQEEKIAANKEFANTILEELKELKRKAELFVGTESILKLNEEVKKDLFEVQKLDSRVRMHADKSEQFFIELRSLLAENQKLDERVSTLESYYSNMNEAIQKLHLSYGDFITRKEYDSHIQLVNQRLSKFGGVLSGVDVVSKEIERLGRVIESILAISERNKRDIDNLAMTLGDSGVDSVAKYESQMDSLLNIVDVLSGEVAKLKERLGIKNSLEVSKEERTEEDSKELEDINKLIAESMSCIKSKMIEEAKENYLKIEKIYNDLSEEERKKVYSKVVEVYKKTYEVKK